jgi:hypothetical protein|tara:strand:- start:37 stop:681 length:645 start_codon:yes stop_codon:yes gene_type:complete
MGCDVHMYVEKYNNNTKSWESVGKKFPNTYAIEKIIKFMSHHLGTNRTESSELVLKFLLGEKPKNKFEHHVLTEFLPNEIPTEDEGTNWWDDGKLPYPYTDTPYQGRNYSLFGVLAGVRDSGNHMDKIVDWERGLPDDVSSDICSLSDEWGIDGHSHNHIYMDELINSKYYTMSEKELEELGLHTHFFNDTINTILHFVGGDPKDIRLVFWFDN